MDKKIKNFNKKTKVRPGEDLLVLANTYSLTQLNYIDISRQEHCSHMMARWPLLEELAQLTSQE